MSITNSLKKLQRKEDLEKEFIESGERDRVEEIVVRRLEETGWTQKVEGMCQDYIAKNLVRVIYNKIELNQYFKNPVFENFTLILAKIFKFKGCERIELKKMVDEMKDTSRKLVPDEVKRELMKLIQDFVNSRTAVEED